jgi:hypothetical protein
MCKTASPALSATKSGESREREYAPRAMTTFATPPPRIAQASGMVSVQAGCSVDEALLLLSQRADETHQSLNDIATRVIDRKLRFN